jgi:hypothetical protein
LAYSECLINRGVTLRTDATEASGDDVRRCIFLASTDACLFAVDAVN